MKISDEELQKWINNIELMGTQTHLLPFLTELQQLRVLLTWKPVSDGINNDLDLFLINMDGTDDLSNVHAVLRTGDQFTIDGVYCPREDVYFGQWELGDILEEYPNATWREIVTEDTNEN